MLEGYYEFGPFRLEPAERRLARDGKDVRLHPKGFDLLVTLVRRAGSLASKNDLLSTVWPDAQVEEANLATQISHIRQALGDADVPRRYVETVPKSGYRFVAPVTVFPGSDSGRNRPRRGVDRRKGERRAPA